MAGKRQQPIRKVIRNVMAREQCENISQLSVVVEIPRDTLDDYSGRKKDYPEYRKLREQANKLGITVQELVDGLLDDADDDD